MTYFRALTFLGTASGTPSVYRNVSSYCLSWTDGAVWMFDCGEGTQHQLLRCPDVSLGKIEKIFITHLHGDHCWGLPGLLCSMAMLWSPPGVVPTATFLSHNKKGSQLAAAAAASSSSPDGQTNATSEAAEDDEEEEVDENEDIVHDHFSPRSKYLEIYGPPKTGAFLREVLRSSEARFGFQYRVNEVVVPPKGKGSSGEEGEEKEALPPAPQYLRDEAPTRWIFPIAPHRYNIPLDDAAAADSGGDNSNGGGGIVVQAAELDHRVISIGYAVTEPPTPGTLDMSRATALGVPKGPLLSKLKNGETVQFPVAGEEALRTVRPDQVVGPATKGRTALLLGDTCNSDETIPIATGADWVVHESTFDNSKSHLAIPRGHSTAKMAGEFAQKIGAKNLILTHFSARYPSSQKDPVAMENIRSEAQVVFSNGPVYVADDLVTFEMPRKKREAQANTPPPQKKQSDK